MAFAHSVLLKHYQQKLTLTEKNFQRLSTLGMLDIPEQGTFYCLNKAGAPLQLKKSSKHSLSEKPGTFILSIAHEQVTNDGVVFHDPKQEVLVDPVNMTAAALSFSMSDLGTCKRIYFKGREPRATTYKENNTFLSLWLSTLIMQGFSVSSTTAL